MSDADAHATDADAHATDADAHATAVDAHDDHDAGHIQDDHDSGHGQDDPAAPLGAPDLPAWAAALGGGAVGLLVVLALYAATQG